MFIYTPADTYDPKKDFASVPLHQTLFFKKWQQMVGRKVISLAADTVDGEKAVFIQCICYSIPFFGSYWTAYGGPIGSFYSISQEESFLKELKKKCIEVEPKLFFIRIQGKPTSRYIHTHCAKGLIGHFGQHDTERVISCGTSIEPTLNTIFSVGVRRAVKAFESSKQPEYRFEHVTEDFSSHGDAIYAILRKTSGIRDVIEEKKYYMDMLQALDTYAEGGSLVLGYTGKRKTPNSFMLVIYTQHTARVVLFGADDDAYQTRLFLLTVYTSIKQGIEKGMRKYSFGSTPDSFGLYNTTFGSFIHQFVQDVTILSHAYDIVVSSPRYVLFVLLYTRGIVAGYRFVKRQTLHMLNWAI